MKQNVKQLVAERRYWEKLSYMVGWRLIGWTDRKHATYKTDLHNGTLTVSGEQRDAIVHTYEKVAEIKLPSCLTCGDRKTIIRQTSNYFPASYVDIPCPTCCPKRRKR